MLLLPFLKPRSFHTSPSTAREKTIMESFALKSPLFALSSINRLWPSENGSKYPYSSSSFHFSCLLPSFSQQMRLKGRAAIVSAAKKENKNSNKRKKENTHNFFPRPDEATGPFPEAVLLKERKVQEDGRRLPEFADEKERELFECLTLQLESDMDVDQMKHFEVIYLIHEDYKDEVENVNTKVQEFVNEKKGKTWRFNDWGMRRLAYKVQKANNAHYILMNFELDVKWINDFKSMLDKDVRVIRHLVLKQDKAETQDCPPPPEFHTLCTDMNDDDDDEDDIDYEEEDEDCEEEEEEEDIDYDEEEYDDEDWDDRGDSESIIYVDDDTPDTEMRSSFGKTKQKSPDTEMSTSSGKTKKKAEKVAR